ncbi:MAG: gamma-glutamylcyclotransferase [Lachnospiraceae bacterium]|nr:gamma-glutamylcyclotransferase [Lachnospiraceae bacterium]
MSETKKRFYIAYGSNLSVEQMKVRTPDAKIVGTGILYGWRLLFKVHATVEPCEGKNTPVLVWEISERDEERLDRYEGYPSYYYKQDLELEVFPIGGGEPVTLTAMVYLMTEGRRLAAPYPDYYGILEEGYKRFHFPKHILEQALADSIGRKNAIRMLGEKCTLARKGGGRDAVCE